MSQTIISRVTLKDVALACGYTANTVSRALRGDTKLPESTRETIRKCAREMGYVPNRSARALRCGSSHTIAIIVNDINNPYYSNMLSLLDQMLKEKGYHTMILCTQLDEKLAGKMISLACSQMVDGILFYPFSNPDHIRQLHESGVPFVLLSRWIPGVQADISRLDDRMGGYKLTRHLLDLGHRRLLYFAGPFVNSSQIDRQSGVMEALKDYGLDPAAHLRIIPWDALPASPQPENMMRLLSPLDYTGVIAYNDVLAYHCLNALRANGLRVPEDISIAGFDYIRWNNTYLPPLTSIEPDGDGIAKTAVQMLFSRMDDPDKPFTQRVLPVRLHLDGTTAAPVSGRNVL